MGTTALPALQRRARPADKITDCGESVCPRPSVATRIARERLPPLLSADRRGFRQCRIPGCSRPWRFG